MTASYGASDYEFERSVADSEDTLLGGATFKNVEKGDTYATALAGYGYWDEVTRLIPINLIASGDWFEW